MKYTQNLGPFSWTLIQVPDLPAHLGRLLLLHVADGGEGGLAGGVQEQVASNLPDLLLLLDACTGPVFQSTHKVKCCLWMSAHCTLKKKICTLHRSSSSELNAHILSSQISRLSD